MNKKPAVVRVEWRKKHKGQEGTENYHFIGDLAGDSWSFLVRGPWDTAWSKIDATPLLIAKAQQILARRAARAG